MTAEFMYFEAVPKNAPIGFVMSWQYHTLWSLCFSQQRILSKAIMFPKNGCPYLFLAPMEGVGDQSFRKAIASIGGFDEAVRDFIRVPTNAHVKSLASVYDAKELAPIPLAAQIMGSDLELMAQMASELMILGAHRIDVNCGCPSNVVTGRGAGSSLLKDPKNLFDVVKAVVDAVPIPVTVKMRSGYDDISNFSENIKAAEESGVKFITLHPRTKVDGYKPPAKWELIAHAKSLLSIPLVGNGDICSVDDALLMLRTTNCDALMIGRGSIMNPFIFHQIRSHFLGKAYKPSWNDLSDFIKVFLTELSKSYPLPLQVNKLKQLFNFLFLGNDQLIENRQLVLKTTYKDPSELFSFAEPFLKESWKYY